MKVIINLVLACDYAQGQIQHIPEMAFIWSLICMDLHMPNKIGMSKSEYDSSFKWCHIRSSLWLRLVDLRSHFIPVGIKGTFWALIDFSLFAIGPNLHCPRVFRSLHLFFLLWLAIIDHSLHIWSTLLLHFWIRTDWNFLEIINGIISLFHNMITLWPIFVYNLKKYGQFRGKYR